MKLVHGSLFSGFDAPSVAASCIGWENAFHCEINPFCNEILKYWFPNSEHYEDITKTDFRKWRGRIDILTGGFPCQPFSLAGQRKGADDNRYLWPQMLRAIREIRPTWVIGENVAGILTMVQPGKETEMGGQPSLFGEENRKRVLLQQEYVVEAICKDLEREGYSVQPLLIPACAVGAPHRRDRVWFVARLIADTTCYGSGGTPHESCRENERQDGNETQQPFFGGCVRDVTNSDGNRRLSCQPGEGLEKRWRGNISQPEEWRDTSQWFNGFHGLSRDASDSDSELSSEGHGQMQEGRYTERVRVEPFNFQTCWQAFPTQSPVCRGNDGIPFDVDRLTIPFTKWRQESVKGYGNAIVPQVILEIFKAIEEIERLE